MVTLPALKPCLWCGRRGRHHVEWHASREYDMYYSAEILCSNCSTHTTRFTETHRHRVTGEVYGHEDFEMRAVQAWNDRRVYLPFRLVLPQNHYIISRSVASHNPAYADYSLIRTEFQVPVIRRLADHLRQAVAFLDEFGVWLPAIFRLHESQFVWWQMAQIESVEQKPGFTHFTLLTRSRFTSFDRNRVDGAWLKTPAGERPPFRDAIFEKLGDDA